jgi:hypothetical protein
MLASDEESTFANPETGEIVADTDDFGPYLGCKADKNAPPTPQF